MANSNTSYDVSGLKFCIKIQLLYQCYSFILYETNNLICVSSFDLKFEFLFILLSACLCLGASASLRCAERKHSSQRQRSAFTLYIQTVTVHSTHC